jgi:hypothetical protein
LGEEIPLVFVDEDGECGPLSAEVVQAGDVIDVGVGEDDVLGVEAVVVDVFDDGFG